MIVNRAEVGVSMKKLKNSKGAGKDKNIGEMVKAGVSMKKIRNSKAAGKDENIGEIIKRKSKLMIG